MADAKSTEQKYYKPAAKTTPKPDAKKDIRAEAATMSSDGAELAAEATVTKEDGKVTLDAGGPYIAAAPQPTPAEAVLYPATGGLPDTGPNSKYVAGEDRGPKLFNAEGERVDAYGNLIDEFGDVIQKKGDAKEAPQPDPMSEVSAATRAEMEAGRAALNRH